MAEFPAPEEGIVLTHFIVSSDVERSRRFYTTCSAGDRPGRRAVHRAARQRLDHHQRRRRPDRGQADGHARDRRRTRIGSSSFLNIRVADIEAVHAEWSARGAEFLTPPQDRGAEIRCYVRDPDGASDRGRTDEPLVSPLAGR